MKLRNHLSPPHTPVVRQEKCKVKNVMNPVPRKRGRPPKRKLSIEQYITDEIDETIKHKTNPSFSFKTPMQSRQSTLASWKRAFNKYSPTTETFMSPLRAVLANLGHKMRFKDNYVDIHIWVVNMSEQFYYDNTLLLLNGSKTDLGKTVKVLRRNFNNVDISFFTNLVDITLLGKGSFGSVYSCLDLATNAKYAVKYIAPKFKKRVEHCENILDYMAERNSIIRSMNSPFVTNFYYSLQLKSIGGLFLFFELCIGDLTKYIKFISLNDYKSLSKKLYKNESNVVQDLDKDLELLDVSLMYVFELFCGLDFLVKANIIHQDIKPENLMISQALHLKIGDFGIVYRTRTIHQDTNSELVSIEDLNTVESSNYDLIIQGTPYYYDFETLMMTMKEERNPFYGKVTKNKNVFDVAGISFDEKTVAPAFLTDTWAAGMVAVNLLFRGFDLLEATLMHPQIFPDIPRGDTIEFTIHLTARNAVYTRYIWNGLTKAGGSEHKELMQFIASIFRPRKTRADKYVSEKSIFKFIKKRTLKYVDMNKVENFNSFKSRKFSSKNIFTLQVPEGVREIYKKHRNPKFPTFQKLLEHFSQKSTGQNIIDLKPGLTINNFP